MNVAFDIDGTIDSFPQVMLGLVTALTAAGHHVYIITGIEQDKVTPTDVRNKKAFLIGLGFGPGTYKELIVLPQPHDTNKADQIKKLDIELLIDNSVANAKAAKTLCAVLILWNSKVKV